MSKNIYSANGEGKTMNALTKIYWSRVLLGIIAAFISAGYGAATGLITTNPDQISLTALLNSMSLAIIIYLISYAIFKSKFALKVEKPQKIFTMGIGIYFLAWIVFWTLLYTIIAVA